MIETSIKMKILKTSIGAILASVILLTSCEDKPKNYATFSGEVSNLNVDADSVLVFIPNGYKKSIVLNEDGTFSDTLNVEEGKYKFKIGDEYGTIYLKNNESLHLKTDYQDFDNALEFTGEGEILDKTQAETKLMHLQMGAFTATVADLDDEAFDQKIADFRKAYNDLKAEYKNLDPSFWKGTDETMETNITGFQEYRASKKAIAEKLTGIKAPSFEMESIEGGMVKLEDFAGKYVYIDVWATWCGPCKREIPSLKELEEDYKGKNIAIISMSIDELKDKKKWQAFVIEEELKGVQIFAENAWKSDFITAFEVKSIPRFILIGPDGIVVDPDAPRPSDPALRTLFDEFGV